MSGAGGGGCGHVKLNSPKVASQASSVASILNVTVVPLSNGPTISVPAVTFTGVKSTTSAVICVPASPASDTTTSTLNVPVPSSEHVSTTVTLSIVGPVHSGGATQVKLKSKVPVVLPKLET